MMDKHEFILVPAQPDFPLEWLQNMTTY